MPHIFNALCTVDGKSTLHSLNTKGISFLKPLSQNYTKDVMIWCADLQAPGIAVYCKRYTMVPGDGYLPFRSEVIACSQDDLPNEVKLLLLLDPQAISINHSTNLNRLG